MAFQNTGIQCTAILLASVDCSKYKLGIARSRGIEIIA
jgi:hypothetical protein